MTRALCPLAALCRLAALCLTLGILSPQLAWAQDDTVSVEAIEALNRFQEASKLMESGQTDEALALYALSLPVIEQTLDDSPGDMSGAYQVVAREAYSLGRLTLASQWAARAYALQLKVSPPPHEDLIYILDLQAAVAMGQGKFFEASEYFEIAMTQIRSLRPDDPRLSASPNALAQAFADHDALHLAAEWFERALAVTEARYGPDHPNVGSVLSSMGHTLVAIGRIAEAVAAHRRAQAIFERYYGHEHPDTAHGYADLGWTLLQSGALLEGRRALETALDIRRRVFDPEHPLVALLMAELAEVQLYLGLTEHARALLDGALAIQERRLPPDAFPTTRTRYTLAALAYGEGDLARARDLLRNVLEVRAKQPGGAHGVQATVARHALGYLAAEAGDLDEGVEQLTIAAADLRDHGVDPGQIAVVEARLGELYVRKGDLEAARPHLVEALTLLASSESTKHAWEIYTRYALLADVDGDTATAIFFAKKSVDALESQRQQVTSMERDALDGFADNYRHHYEALAEMLIEAGRLLEAQHTLDLLKAAEYRRFTRGEADAPTPGVAWRDREHLQHVGREAGPSGGYPKVTRRLAAAGRAYEALRARRRQAQREGRPFGPKQEALLERLRGELEAARAAYVEALQGLEAALTDEGRAPSARQLGDLTALQGTLRRLGDGAVIIHALITDGGLHLLVTTAEVQWVRTVAVERGQLHRDIFALRRALSSPAAPVKAAAARMYQHLIAPIREDLRQAGAKILLFSLDGPLRYLPPAALYDAKADRYLIESFEIALYTEAARHTLERPRGDLASAAGLGVSAPKGGFAPLPAVTEELDRLIRLGEGDEGAMPGVIHLDDAFSRRALMEVLDDRHPVVHIASHFAFRPGTEADSFLLLGDGGQLTLGDLRRGAFRFDEVALLTLSACETALSADGSGAEIDGLAAIAQRRGAQSVLATLWPVADVSTARLMGRMYARLVAGDAKAKALRIAQLALLRGEERGTPEAALVTRRVYRDDPTPPSPKAQFTPPPGAPLAHPYYWAPFILMGHWR